MSNQRYNSNRVKRPHYNQEKDTLEYIESIFYDSDHYIVNGTATSRIEEEFIPLTHNISYFKYVAADLYYLGYIGDKDYIRLKNYTGNKFINYFLTLGAWEKFAAKYGNKRDKRNCYLCYTASLELKLCELVEKKYNANSKTSEKDNKTAKMTIRICKMDNTHISNSSYTNAQTVFNSIRTVLMNNKPLHVGYMTSKGFKTVGRVIAVDLNSVCAEHIVYAECDINVSFAKTSMSIIRTTPIFGHYNTEHNVILLVNKMGNSIESIMNNEQSNEQKESVENATKSVDQTKEDLQKCINNVSNNCIQIRCSYNNATEMINDKTNINTGDIVYTSDSKKFYYKNNENNFDYIFSAEPDNDLMPDDYTISWGSYFMGIAQLVKKRSKDPACKVGACIVRDKKILSTGYNGFPRGIDDTKYPWTKDSDDPTKNKFFYVVHAELNAILNSDTPVQGAELYVTKFPCNECAKAIIQSGIKKIIYYDDKDDAVLFDAEKNKVTLSMFNDVGIEIIRYSPIGYNELIHL